MNGTSTLKQRELLISIIQTQLYVDTLIFDPFHSLLSHFIILRSGKTGFQLRIVFSSLPCYISDHTVMSGSNRHFYQHLAIHTA